MRTMIKTISLTLCMAFALLTLAACGGTDMSASKYCGTWEGTTAEYAGITLDCSDLFDGFTLELKSDGKVTLTVDGDDANGKWEETDNGFKVDSDDEMTFVEEEEGVVYLDYDGVILYFEKQ